MTIEIDDDKLLSFCKRSAILLLTIAILLFMILSHKIYEFSRDNPVQYQVNFSRLNFTEKTVASSMKKTGEVENSVLGKNRGHGKGGSKFFEEIEKIHKK